jgi:hypothetical protein
MSDHRDTEVGAALRALGRPEHDKDFFPRLFQLMEAGRALEIEPTPKARRSWFARRPVILAATAVAAAAVVVMLTLVGLPFSDRSGIGVSSATAAQRMLAKFSYAMSTVKTLQGTMQATGPSSNAYVEGEVRWDVKFVVTSEGDFRADLQGDGGEKKLPPMALWNSTRISKAEAYDARTHTRWWLTDKGFCEVRKNAASPIGPPRSSFRSAFAYQDYASTLKALLDEGELEVDETVIDGRAAWSASYPIVGGKDGSIEAGKVTLFVDQETGLLVRYTLESLPVAAGSALGEMTPFRLDVRDLRVNEPVDHKIFRVPTADIRERRDIDEHLTFDSLSKAVQRVEFDALVPSALPDGFRLAEVCSFRWDISEQTPSNVPWTMSSGLASVVAIADPPHNELDLMYRRGLDWVSIEQMPSYPPENTGSELFGILSDRRYFMGSRQVPLDNGALAGSVAHTWLADVRSLGPGSGCGLMALSDREGAAGVRIMGTLTPTELLDMANSLRPYTE